MRYLKMLFNIHFTKALLLASILVLVAILTFEQIIRHNRLEVFQKYSNLTLPPVYKIKENTAAQGNYHTDVWLVFSFDKKNYKYFLRQNQITNAAFNRQRQNNWVVNGASLYRRKFIGPNTTISERINKKFKTLEFHYQKK